MVELPPPDIERRPVTLAGRVLQGGLVALVTAYHHGRANVLPVAWHTPLSSRPPLVGIAIEQSRHSVDVIHHGEQFALNFPSRALLHHVQYLGGWSGADINKLDATQLETWTAAHLDAPLLRDCLAWVECELQETIPLGDHVLFVGLAIAVHVDPRAFDDRWLLADDEARPLNYLGGNFYSALQGVAEARVPGRGDAPERVLRERLTEQLELTREARERREELEEEVREQVARGDVVDLSQLGAQLGVPGLPPLTGGVLLTPPTPDG